MDLGEPFSASDLLARFHSRYDAEPLIRVSEAIPEIGSLAPSTGIDIGGFTVDERDGHRASFVVVLDNLLKGAASQALQNVNRALGLDEFTGIQGEIDD